MISDVDTQPLLPYEVVENMLAYVDGITFARAASVCREWKRIAEIHVKYRDKWKLCCENEINKQCLLELIDKHYDEDCNEPNNYSIIYKNWVQWKILNKKQRTLTVQLLATAETDKSFTYAKAFHNQVYVSTSSGSLLIFNDEERVQTSRLRSPEPITKFSFCPFLKYGKEDNLDEFFNQHVSTDSCESFMVVILQRSRLYYTLWQCRRSERTEPNHDAVVGEMFLEDNVDDIKTFRNAVVIKKSTRVCALEFVEVATETSEHELIKREFKVRPIRPSTTSKNYSVQDFHFFDEKFIKMATDDGTVFKISTSRRKNHVPISVDRKLEYGYMTISKVFMPRNDFILSVSTDGTLVVTIGESTDYISYMSVFRSRPNSVLIYADVLLIGSEAGELFTYNIDNINMFDIRMPDKRIFVSTLPIICLDVYHDETNDPKIIALTEKCIYSICKSLI